MRFLPVLAGLSCLLAVPVATGCVGPVVETAGITPPAAFQQAEAAYQRGDLSQAREGFRSFARRNPRSPFTAWACYWQGRVDLKEERFQEAEYAFRRALEARPEPLLRGPLLMALGDVEFNRRQYKDALRYYRQVDAEGLATTVKQDELFWKTGLAFLRTGDRRQADRSFRKVEHFPGSPYIEESRRRMGSEAPLAPALQYVLVGDFSRWESAERVRNQVGASGFRAHVERVPAAGGHRYEVRVAVVGDRREAQGIADALRAKGFSPTVVP